MFVWLGDPTVDQFKGDHLVFVAAGSDPFDVITKAIKSVTFSLLKILHFSFASRILVLRRISLSFNDLCRAVEQHLQTFSHRERKKVRKLVSTSIFSDLIRN